ncbi:MAG: protein tyrosine phosphatase [Proteobacteria bacterium]|nr:MAG: protein tyrosine phosphatase [Pseudomonadota bacterium]
MANTEKSSSAHLFHVKPIRVLFVCLGNICRSPLAEIIVQGQAEKKDVREQFTFASAGTGDWHVGRPADVRSAQTASQHGLDLSQHRAQQITANKINDWDWFVAMDDDNRSNLLAMGVPENRLLMMRQFETDSAISLDVPDPYYGGTEGFEDAYVMLCDNADHILDYLLNQRG